ncbi:unnamed protein product [Ectocarpus sp. 6 AP-2014]
MPFMGVDVSGPASDPASVPASGPDSDTDSGPDSGLNSRPTGRHTPEAIREGLVARALHVALLQINEEETSWFTSTGQLDLVSTTISHVARGAPVANVVVNDNTSVDALRRTTVLGHEYQGRYSIDSAEIEARVRELPAASALRMVWRAYDAMTCDFNDLQENMHGVKWLSIEANILAPAGEGLEGLSCPTVWLSSIFTGPLTCRLRA